MKRSDMVMVALGLLAMDLWCDVMGHSPASSPANDLLASLLTNPRVFWNAALIVCCALMVAFPRTVERFERAGDISIPLLACFTTIIYGWVGPDLAHPGMLILLVSINSICYGWIEIRLLAECARLDRFSDIVFVIAASQILKMPLAACIGLAPHAMQLVIDEALPLVLLPVFFLLGRTRAGIGINAAIEPARVPLSAPDQTAILTLLILLPIMNSFSRALSNLGFWGSSNVIDSTGLFAAALSSLFFAILVAVSFTRCANQAVIGHLLISLVILLGCLTLFDQAKVADAGLPPFLASSLTAATELYSHFLFWFVAVAAIRMVDRHPYRLAAVTELAMSIVAFIFGIALQRFDNLGLFLIDGAMFVAVTVAVALLWRMRGAAIEPPDIGNVEAICARIAPAYRLSPRESEVFVLLAQGRSRVFIQEAMSLSDSTVKAHTSHIYQKLGVHSKQELISLVRGNQE